MGGTSTDVCLIAGGRGRRARAERVVGGFPIRLPTRRHRTPSAPAAARSSGATRAARCASGPQSAGAEPGPACYGRGGTRADRDRREPPARPAAARARRAGSSSTGTRRSARSAASTRRDVVAVVNAEMLRALRVVSVERGPRPARLRARRLRRRRPAARLRARRGARDPRRCSSRRRPACSRRSGSRRATSGATRVRSYVGPLDGGRRAAARGRGRPPLPRASRSS